MKRAIILMTRVPHPGATKTRLMSALCGKACAELHQRFLDDYFQCFASMKGLADYFVAYAPEHVTEAFFEGIPRQYGRFEQRGANIGERMHHAFEVLFERGYGEIVLVGCDAPGLQPNDYRQAFEALATHDMVVSPTFDGGYCLIGLRENFAQLFNNTVGWGGQSVIDRTLSIAKKWGRKAMILKQQWDIDVEEDLLAFCEWIDKDWENRSFYPVRTIQFIEEVLSRDKFQAQGNPVSDSSLSAKQRGLPRLLVWRGNPRRIPGPRGVQRKLSG